MIETEIFGITLRGVPFGLFPTWLQLATGIPIVIGVIMACAAAFIIAPNRLNESGSTATAEKIVGAGLLMTIAGLVSILVTALVLP